jgi:hypothetical protein
MARITTAGAESQDVGGGVNVERMVATVGSVAVSATQVRSGTRSYKCDSGGSNQATYVAFNTSGVSGTVAFIRACFYFETSLPGSTITIGDWLGVHVRLTSGGKLQVTRIDDAVQWGSDSSVTIAAGQWYRIELKYDGTAASGSRVVELRVDGTTEVSASNVTDNFTSGNTGTGWRAAPGANKVLYFDDFAYNDATGSDQNSWPGDGKVVLLLPISDNARDTLWTGGAGGTTNLWDAVNNTPPVGTATETNTTQIEHAGGAAGTTDRYDANMTTYATAGIGASDTINLVLFVEADGEDIATGSKLLNFEVLSNPAIASPGNITAGDNVGALGTYPINWSARFSPPVYNPSVTVGTSPVMRVRRPETASRVASVCFMGMYVDYTPAAAASDDLATKIVGSANPYGFISISGG